VPAQPLPPAPPILRFYAKTKSQYVWLGRSSGGRRYFGRDFAEAQKKYAAFCDEWRRAHQPGERYTTDSYGRAVGYAIERANRKRGAEDPPLPLVARWRPNQLRHLAASEAAEHFDRSHASAMLGNGMDVIDVYVEQELRKAARAAAIG